MTTAATFQLGQWSLPTDRAHVMGILNVTPDSFSDGGQFRQRDDAIKQALAMVKAGAAVIDIGGESTRPGAEPVSEQEELDRVIPVIERLTQEVPVAISVDTSTAKVMAEAAKAGANLINDVRALQREGALAAAAETGLPVCLMHMQGQPKTMQADPQYVDVVSDVAAFLKERIRACETVGIARDKILLDPGFGFGKTLKHNLTLLNRLAELETFGCPLLVGLSRKSMIGQLLDKPVDERLTGSLALAAAAQMNQAFMIRVHDVPETVELVTVLNAVKTLDVDK